jgi:hypothetical protein
VLLLTAAAASRSVGAATAAKEVKLAECSVFVHQSSGTMIVVKGDDYYFGTSQHVVAFSPGNATSETDKGVVIKFSHATSEGKQGILVYCGSDLRFYEPASDAAISAMPKGKETSVALCTKGKGCTHAHTPCSAGATTTASTPRPNGPPQPGGNGKQASNVVQAGAQTSAGAAAPGVVLIEGERVQPAEAMIFTRSILMEEGPSVAAMNEFQENINKVRYNMNTYRLGYALASEKVGSRHVFSGAVKGWRGTSTGDVSAWPEATYPVARREARRRAQLLDPIIIAEPIDEMNNLRLYYLPSLVGHDGREYTVIPTAIAFCIHPRTGGRMTIMVRDGRTYGAVNGPLAVTSNIYVKDVESYPVGPFGLGTARIPSVFYSKVVRFDVEPFPQGDPLDRLMGAVLAARSSGPLATTDFRALYQEMTRYTGGKVE